MSMSLTLPLKLINCLSVVCKIYFLNGMLKQRKRVTVKYNV